MRNWRVALFSFFICFPAVLVITVGAWLIFANVPRAIRNEPSRIGREYRDIAEDLIAHPEKAGHSGPRVAGWRQVSKINGTPWGYAVNGDRTTVWFRNGEKEWRWTEMDAITPFPYALVFYGGGAVAALVLIFLTAMTLGSLRKFDRERDDFLAAAAHDLTTPIVAMRRLIGRNDEEAKRLNERMSLVVSNLKDFLKLGGKRREPVPSRFDAVALCHEAYELFKDDYEDSEGGAVAFDFSRLVGETAEIVADETMTLQILWNLFGNDLKYAAPYGKVEVRVFIDGKDVVVDFVDEGMGMTPAQMNRAFDRYYRAKTVLETGKGGFGIGLCTAREFARAMGGDLTVCANEPKGCVFTLRLPKAE